MSGRGARALIIGWDGATWDLADRFVAEGAMPVLAGLLSRCARAPLNSTTPPMTLPSWSSMLTGCNPGKHGIFDFTQRRPGALDLRFNNATHRRAPTLHRILSDRGARVASIAVPTTWPPEALNGVVVSGFDSPVSTGIDGSFCHPPELYGQLQARFGGLHFADFQESRIGPGWHDAALSALLTEIPRKEAIGCWLLDQERWDCFMLMFGESDTVSHHFWMFHDPNSPRHPAHCAGRLRDAIRSVYQALDASLGRLLERAQPDVLCICSDHGFGGAGEHVLYLNRYLESAGWLRMRRRVVARGLQSGTGLRARARAMALQHLPGRLQGRVFRALPDRLVEAVEAGSRYGELDPVGLRAFSEEQNYSATLHLDVPPAERVVATAELAGLLLDWRVDGAAPVRAVHRREDLYRGPCVDRSPDLVLDLNLRGGYSYTLLPSSRAAPAQTWRLLERSEHVGGKGLGMNGSHRQHGLLLLSGRGVAEGAQIHADMADIAPTLLTLLGESVPAHMDGRVLRSALTPTAVDAARADLGAFAAGGRGGGAWSGTLPAPRDASLAETQVIRQRLERLGYL